VKPISVSLIKLFCAFLCQHAVLNQHGKHVPHIYRIDRTPSCYLPPEVVSSLSIHSPTPYYISFHILPAHRHSLCFCLTPSVVDLHDSVGVGGYKEKGMWMGHGKGQTIAFVCFVVVETGELGERQQTNPK